MDILSQLKHAWKASGSHASRAFNRGILHPIECLFARPISGGLPTSPIFIIGSPRSGSTLLYQLLAQRFDFTYLSNVHASFFGAPSLVELLRHHSQANRTQGQYRSQFGYAKGTWAPSECGEFWYRFFPRNPQHTLLSDVSAKNMARMRGVVGKLQEAGNKPLLFKNMPCALRLEPLIHALPEAIFLVMQRNLLDNAHSILCARKTIYHDYGSWWSLKPRSYPKLRILPAHVQVVEQIRAINDLIDQARNQFGDERFLDVQYETLCDNTHDELNSIERFLKNHGLTISHNAAVPASFPHPSTCNISSRVYQQLQEYISARAA